MTRNFRRPTVPARAALFLAGALSLFGCAVNFGGESAPEVPVTRAALPSSVQRYQPIEDILTCIRQTGAVKGITFVVGPFADSTGKINYAAGGATGNFIPQGGSASYITDALRKAGADVVSTYFGEPRIKAPAHYAINGIFNSLDFGAPVGVDVRVGGIGPTVSTGWAQLSLTIQLDEVGTRLNRQISMIQRPVRYSQVGIGIGRDINDTLVTGNVAFQNQERLQLEALNGPIALGVAEVLLREFAEAQSQCSNPLNEVLQPFGVREADVDRQAS
jgi:hypothetical protein